MFVYSHCRIPIKVWMKEEDYWADPGMVQQVEHCAMLPFSKFHVALAPDGHLGYGMPIGGVLATDDVVVPNAVGVDIGCGLLAARTNQTEVDTETLKLVLGDIRKQIPVGFSHRQKMVPEDQMPEMEEGVDKDWDYPVVNGYKDKHFQLRTVDGQYDAARTQMGTLGGGKLVASLAA